ncbi:MAG: histidine kinase [Rubrivivax sp.]|jgi:two-component sensor histidine kinase|nr:histidine kinase [Rubrivivax sp.]
MACRPLAQGNRLQRWYAAWAAPYYERMPEHLRSDAMRIDQWLYGPGGAGLALGLAGAVGGTTAALMATRMPWPLALGLSVLAWACLGLSLLAAWLQPEKFSARRLLRASLKIVALGYLGALCGYLVGRFVRQGDLGTETLAQALRGAAVEATPILLALLLAVLLALWGVAQVKRVQVQRELTHLRLVQERDAAARQAAESQLHLLQAQIQPHFLFNTLATLQHWVDAGDPRAAALLRDLTAFLRGSTTLLAQAEVALADEAEAARQYLRILQARLGQRLQFSIDICAASAARTLPAGILLTLVENAVEHGISPALHGGTVQVQARSQGAALVLEVRDDGAGLALPLAEGLGLANCRQRLQHRYGPQATLSLLPLQPGACARVEVHGT